MTHRNLFVRIRLRKADNNRQQTPATPPTAVKNELSYLTCFCIDMFIRYIW